MPAYSGLSRMSFFSAEKCTSPIWGHGDPYLDWPYVGPPLYDGSARSSEATHRKLTDTMLRIGIDSIESGVSGCYRPSGRPSMLRGWMIGFQETIEYSYI